MSKTILLGARVTPEVNSRVEAEAKAEGKTKSDFVRETVLARLDRKPQDQSTPPPNPQAVLDRATARGEAEQAHLPLPGLTIGPLAMLVRRTAEELFLFERLDGETPEGWLRRTGRDQGTKLRDDVMAILKPKVAEGEVSHG